VVIEQTDPYPYQKCDASFTAYFESPYTVSFQEAYKGWCGTPPYPYEQKVVNKIAPGGCVMPYPYKTQYRWTFGDGAEAITDYKNVSHTYKPGKYLVKLLVETHNIDSNIRYIMAPLPMCQDSSEIWITVNEDGSIEVSSGNVILTNIFPNPLSENGSLSIENADRLVEFNIYNLSGMLVKKFEGLNNGISTFEIGDLPIGIYMYTIISDGKLIKKDKFSVKR
jgi:hypothetical protein